MARDQAFDSTIPDGLAVFQHSPILSRYDIYEEIGRGGMGIVYRGRHRLLEKTVAIKSCVTGRHVERFQREAKLLATITSPYIVPVHDFELLPDGRAVLVMDWIAGKDLHRLLKDQKEPISEEVVLAWMLQVSEGMAAAQELGIVHRDLKPSNVLLDGDEIAHVADFGLAVADSLEQLTMSGGMMGTPHYMAPEQAEDPRRVDSRADIYSFGATFYHVLTGLPPFQADSAFSILYKHKTAPLVPPRNHRPNLSDKVNAILERCLAKTPADRFNSFQEIVAQLRVSTTSTTISPWMTTGDDVELQTILTHYFERRSSYFNGAGRSNTQLDCFEFPNGQTIQIILGDLLAQRVEAVVSSDTCDLTMQAGISASIREAAGRFAEREARLKAPIRPGRVVVTSAGSMHARLIFHAGMIGVVDQEFVRPSRDLIAEIVSSCFYHADTHNVRSMAFPLLGLSITHKSGHSS